VKYQTTDAFLLNLLRRINDNWDNWLLFTGEEGTGKSKTARKLLYRLDWLQRNWRTAMVQLKPKPAPKVPLRDHWQPNYPAPRPFTLTKSPEPNCDGDSIRFGQSRLLDLLNELEVGGVAVGDEIEGHKRLAMYSERLELLDHTKESRGLRHTVGLCFPQPTEFERSILNMRVYGWVHQERRGMIVVRERVSSVSFNAKAEIESRTRWPKVGRFPITPGNDVLESRYEPKKLKRMRDRSARRREDDEPETPPQPEARPHPVILDQVLAELKRGP